jgi:hypothetical protein
LLELVLDPLVDCGVRVPHSCFDPCEIVLQLSGKRCVRVLKLVEPHVDVALEVGEVHVGGFLMRLCGE